MRNSFFRFCFFVMLTGMLHLTFPVSILAVQQKSETSSSKEEISLRRFLQSYLGPQQIGPYKTRYIDVFTDLNGDGIPEVIVYLVSEGWCGSGGCCTLILAQKNSSYEIVTKISIVKPPVRVLDSTSNGWHNLAVWVHGGGFLPSYEAELRFNGKTYPSNPSMPPARHLTRKAAGKTVIPSLQGAKPLYP